MLEAAAATGSLVLVLPPVFVMVEAAASLTLALLVITAMICACDAGSCNYGDMGFGRL